MSAQARLVVLGQTAADKLFGTGVNPVGRVLRLRAIPFQVRLRMAVGAQPWHVLSQFLVEAVSLSMAGGLFGIAIGLITARTVAGKLGWPFALPIDTVALAFGFSALVGIVFGLYPGRKASHLDPIEALRFE